MNCKTPLYVIQRLANASVYLRRECVICCAGHRRKRLIIVRAYAQLPDTNLVSRQTAASYRTQAMKKAKDEYRKYQEITLSPVEEEYLKSVRGVEKEVKKHSRGK